MIGGNLDAEARTALTDLYEIVNCTIRELIKYTSGEHDDCNRTIEAIWRLVDTREQTEKIRRAGKLLGGGADEPVSIIPPFE